MKGAIMYLADEKRYDAMEYHRCGKSGLKLPLLSLGLWHNFGTTSDFENMKNKFSSIDKVTIMDTTVDMSYKKILKDLYGAMMNIIGVFENSRIVVTDRYHGMIYSLVSNTPVIVMKTTDHKVIEGYKILKKQYPDRIWFAESPDKAFIIAQEVLKTPRYEKLDNYFQREIYGKLRKTIEKELIV